MKRRVLVTGATGAMGSYLCPVLRDAAECEVLGTRSLLSDRNYEVKGVDYEAVDLAQDTLGIDRIVRLFQPKWVFHLASRANVLSSFRSPASIALNNVACTLHVLDAVRRFAPRARFIHCSSSEVYGAITHDECPVDESAPLRPVSPYAGSKVAQEALVTSFGRSYKLDYVITRAFGYVNPRRPDLVLTSFAEQIKRTAVVCHGNLDSIRTFLDARDIAIAYWLAAVKCESGEAYNIGATKGMSVRSALDELEAVAGLKVKRILDPELLRPADVSYQIPRIGKFTSATGWSPEISFKESLRWLLDEVGKT